MTPVGRIQISISTFALHELLGLPHELRLRAILPSANLDELKIVLEPRDPDNKMPENATTAFPGKIGGQSSLTPKEQLDKTTQDFVGYVKDFYASDRKTDTDE